MKSTSLPAMVLILALAPAAPCLAQQQERQPQPPEQQQERQPAQPQPYRLSLDEAIARGLRANLRVLTSGAAIEEAAGARERRLSALLPKAQGALPVTLQSRNLHAFGISLPNVPEVVGPFGTVDFRMYFSQPVIDLPSYHRWKSSEKQEQATRLDYQSTRNAIVELVAALYLNGESAAARVASAQSRVDTAQALYQLAVKQHDAGVATGVDVLRAQVALANERQNLVEAKNTFQQTLLALERAIGMQPGTVIELTRKLCYQPLTPPNVEAAVSGALGQRDDYRAMEKQREALVEQQKANHSRYLPSLSVDGDYGGIGRTLNKIRATTTLSATLRFTLFDRDRAGESTELASRISALDAQIADLRRGIEQDIRSALLNLEAASEAVSVAQQGQQLAERELRLSRDRFRTGVTNNIEVTTAQDSLARAEDNYTAALTQHEAAKVALARALGGTEKSYRQYLGKP
jgi:outer membrane protein TolC